MIIELTSADLSANSRLDDYTPQRRQLRSKVEPERGLYMAESAGVIERRPVPATAALFLMSKALAADPHRRIEAATGTPDGADVIFVADEDVSEQMTGFRLHRGAWPPCGDQFCRASARKSSCDRARRRARSPHVVVLRRPRRPHRRRRGIPSAAPRPSASTLSRHLPVRQSSTIDPCVSPWGPSSGAWTRLDSWPATSPPSSSWLHGRVAGSVGRFGVPRLTSLRCPSSGGPDASLVMGTEGDGLARRTIAASDYTVKFRWTRSNSSTSQPRRRRLLATRGIGGLTRRIAPQPRDRRTHSEPHAGRSWKPSGLVHRDRSAVDATVCVDDICILPIRTPHASRNRRP